MLIKQSGVPYHMDSHVPLCLYPWLNLPKTRNWRAWAVFSCRPLRQLSAVVCPSLSLANSFQRMTAAFRRVRTLVHWPLTVACLQSSGRALCTCAILNTEVSILCFCSAWWNLPAPDNADEWASRSADKETIGGPLCIASASLELKSLTGCNRCFGIPELYSSRDVRNLGKGIRVYQNFRIFLLRFRIQSW